MTVQITGRILPVPRDSAGTVPLTGEITVVGTAPLTVEISRNSSSDR